MIESKWNIDFISRDDFKKHVVATIKSYEGNLTSFDLARFNKNLIDPIKLTFDKLVYSSSWEDIIKNEIYRQRDKSNTNSIGFFHQNIFKYIKGCEVPKAGFDVIYRSPKGITVNGIFTHTINAELKNKHNTMNSGSSKSVFIKLQNGLIKDPESINCLVEAIAKESHNIVWQPSFDGEKVYNERIRRISMDKFYEIVTGDPNGFYKICLILPSIIKEIVSDKLTEIPNDTVLSELKKINNGDIAIALYMLGFSTYNGFASVEKNKYC